MKHLLITFSIIVLVLSSCSENEHDVKTQTTLSVHPHIGHTLSRANEKIFWKEKDSIGVFFSDDYKNIKYVYTDDIWGSVNPIILGLTARTVTAYYPYSGCFNTEGIPVDIKTGIDYLYGSSSTAANYDNPSVSIELKHALTQLNLQFVKGSYDGIGHITSVKLVNRNSKENIATKGTLDIMSGIISDTKAEDYVISDKSDTISSEPVSVNAMLIPMNNIKEKGDVRLELTIDGVVLFYDFASDTSWKAGYRNSYKTQINKNTLTIANGDINITAWEDYTESTNVNLKPLD